MKKKSPGHIAIERLGGPSAVAKLFKVSPWAVSKWRKRVPPKRVLKLSRLSGVSAHAMRPDIYPDDEAAA